MTPAEFWTLYDHHLPEQRYGSLRESEVEELLEHLEEQEKKWQSHQK